MMKILRKNDNSSRWKIFGQNRNEKNFKNVKRLLWDEFEPNNKLFFAEKKKKIGVLKEELIKNKDENQAKRIGSKKEKKK